MWKVTITLAPEAEEAASELIQPILGVTPSSYFDVQKRRTVLSFFFAKRPSLNEFDKAQVDQVFARIRSAGLPVGNPRLKLTKVPPQDWAESWKKHFKPLEIGRELLIKPSWSHRKQKPGQALVIIDPGLSFGTGQHPTTEFCLHQIVKLRREKKRQRLSFFDAGTGSAILAIAAAKLGYSPIHAIDFDPVALRVARINANKNKVSRRIRLRVKDVTKLPGQSKPQYSLICANLISNVLVEVRRKLLNLLEPGGTLVIAGILKTEFGDVQKSFETLGLRMTGSRAEREWRSGVFRKPV